MDDVSARLGVDVATARPALLQQTSSQTPASRCAFPAVSSPLPGITHLTTYLPVVVIIVLSHMMVWYS